MSSSVKCNVCSDVFKTTHPKKHLLKTQNLKLRDKTSTLLTSSYSSHSSSYIKAKNLSIAVCCSANVNRSMAAHKLLKEHSFNVESFGVSDAVRLPAPNHEIKEFTFGTPYTKIIEEITKIDEEWYRNQDILYIMERNSHIKEAPQRFQDYKNIDQFDVILCCDSYCYNTVYQFLIHRSEKKYHPVYLLGINVPDTPKEAEIWSLLLLHILSKMNKVKSGKISITNLMKRIKYEENIDIQHSLLIV